MVRDRCRPRRRIVLVSWCGLLGALVVATAAPAPGDAGNPLTALVDAAAQRLQVAEAVAAFKWTTHAAIEDPARVDQELSALGADAAERHADPAYVTRVFSDQIDATEAIEYRRFADWKLDPATAPVMSAADLSASRSDIDGLNQTMLAQIVTGWDALHSPGCPSLLAAATRAVTRARQLDDLYQRALSLATRSYCQ
ncbi:chorismate mutase [Mycobacterium parmense]|uniref:chorismate mutase n=1 Tax=Mycobacterium parmense TaxID=185642 RepID=UPI000A1530B0|nr:chorismate mutase [Mycobacterium parmense]MCV7353395.1 chorismate mutase [Mycobacterium parmense]ORW51575.1 chorismate mutase [Mycobacterium parmense]